MNYYLPRLLGNFIREALSFSKIIVLTGARQVGKTTLVKNESPLKD